MGILPFIVFFPICYLSRSPYCFFGSPRSMSSATTVVGPPPDVRTMTASMILIR